MKSFKYVVTDELGIHARSAGLLGKEAKQFSSSITIKQAGKVAEAADIFGIMRMNIKYNDEITIEIEGSDEDAAYDAILAFSKNYL